MNRAALVLLLAFSGCAHWHPCAPFVPGAGGRALCGVEKTKLSRVESGLSVPVAAPSGPHCSLSEGDRFAATSDLSTLYFYGTRPNKPADLSGQSGHRVTADCRHDLKTGQSVSPGKPLTDEGRKADFGPVGLTALLRRDGTGSVKLVRLSDAHEVLLPLQGHSAVTCALDETKQSLRVACVRLGEDTYVLETVELEPAALSLRTSQVFTWPAPKFEGPTTTAVLAVDAAQPRLRVATLGALDTWRIHDLALPAGTQRTVSLRTTAPVTALSFGATPDLGYLLTARGFSSETPATVFRLDFKDNQTKAVFTASGSQTLHPGGTGLFVRDAGRVKWVATFDEGKP